MLRADMMINTSNAALHDREVTLNGVRMDVAANILVDTVIDRMVIGLTMASTGTAIVADRVCSTCDLFVHNRTQRLGSDVRHMMRADFTATLDNREHSFFTHATNVFLVALADVLVALFAANVGFVKLNCLARTAKRTSRLEIAHTLADAMHHEPSGLVRQAYHAV